MSEHTKGPWTAHPYNSRMGSLISFGDLSKGETIGIVCGQKDEEEGKANARLIAVAPKLLWALKDVRDFVKRCGYDTTLVDSAIAEAEAVHEAI